MESIFNSFRIYSAPQIEDQSLETSENSSVTEVALSVLDRPAYEREVNISDLKLKENTILRSFEDAEGRQVLLTKLFLRDINGSQNAFYFKKAGEESTSFLQRWVGSADSIWDSKYAKVDFKGKGDEKERENIGAPQVITFLRDLGLNSSEISEFSMTCHQGVSAEPLKLMQEHYPELMYVGPNKEELPTLAETTCANDKLWKVWQEEDAVVFSQQTIIKMIDPMADIEAPKADEVVYLMGTVKVNMGQGTGKVSISAPSRTPPSFDLS